MIKNTYADCVVKEISVTGSTAYVTLLIYSSKPADTHRRFRFYLADGHTNLALSDNDGKTIIGAQYNNDLLLLSPNTYWIDRTNNYENLATNIDTNMYKEIVLEIDISSQNEGEMRNNHWVRECKILMVDLDAKLEEEKVAWTSNLLTLVSAEIAVPQLKNLSYMSDKDWNLYVDFDYEYESQHDFNYNSKNINTVITVKSAQTRLRLESIKINEAHIKNKHVRVQFENPYDDYILINICITNNKGVKMFEMERLYRPQKRMENTYIKHNGVVTKVNYVYYKGDDTITGGPV